VDKPPSSPKGILVSLPEAEAAGCLTKETLTSLCRALTEQTMPSLIILSLEIDSLDGYDFYFYPPRAGIHAPATLVLGGAFQNLTDFSFANPNATLTATSEENPFQTFYLHSSSFLAFRVFFLSLHCALFVALLFVMYRFFQGTEKVVLVLKISLFSLLFYTNISRIIFFSLGGDFVTLFKRVVHELSFLALLLCNTVFLLIWLRVLKFSLSHLKNLLYLGYGVVVFVIIGSSIGTLIRILTFVVGGIQASESAYIALMAFGGFIQIIFLLGALLRTLKILGKVQGSDGNKNNILKKYMLMAWFLFAFMLLVIVLIGVIEVLSSRNLEGFQARLWLTEITFVSLVVFYCYALYTTNHASKNNSSLENSPGSLKLDPSQ